MTTISTITHQMSVPHNGYNSTISITIMVNIILNININNNISLLIIQQEKSVYSSTSSTIIFIDSNISAIIIPQDCC